MEKLNIKINASESIPAESEHFSAVKKLYPELKIGKWEKASSGVNNHVYDADNKYIFRFPREGKEDKLEKEKQILEIAGPKLSVETPVYLFSGDNPKFVGYEKLQGLSMKYKEMYELPGAQRKALAEDISNFFQEFHAAVSHEKAKEIGVKEMWTVENQIPKLRKEFSVPKDGEVLEFLDKLENKIKEHPVPPIHPTLIFHDFHDHNMLLDTETKRLKAVYDFGEVAIGDVHQEFMQLYKRDDRFAEEVVNVYSEKTGEKMDMETVKIYTIVRELRKLRTFRDNKEGEDYNGALENLRKWLN